MSPLRTRMMLAPDASTVPVCSPVRAERLTDVDDRRVVRVRVPIPVSALVDRVIADDAASARRTSKSNVIEGALHDERAQGHAQRAQAGLQPLVERFERHLGRALAAGARNGRRTRLGTLDAVRLSDVMLDLAPDGENPEAAPCTLAARCIVAHRLPGAATRRSSRLASLASASERHRDFSRRVLEREALDAWLRDSGSSLGPLRCQIDHRAGSR